MTSTSLQTGMGMAISTAALPAGKRCLAQFAGKYEGPRTDSFAAWRSIQATSALDGWRNAPAQAAKFPDFHSVANA
jgi:hypothetical protein